MAFRKWGEMHIANPIHLSTHFLHELLNILLLQLKSRRRLVIKR